MKKNIKELLPIGSVIRLCDASKCLMIIGILQKNLETNELYDYITVPYPEGFISKQTVFYAMHEDIDEVLFTGFNNTEREEMIKDACEYLNKNGE